MLVILTYLSAGGADWAVAVCNLGEIRRGPLGETPFLRSSRLLTSHRSGLVRPETALVPMCQLRRKVRVATFLVQQGITFVFIHVIFSLRRAVRLQLSVEGGPHKENKDGERGYLPIGIDIIQNLQEWPCSETLKVKLQVKSRVDFYKFL